MLRICELQHSQSAHRSGIVKISAETCHPYGHGRRWSLQDKIPDNHLPKCSVTLQYSVTVCARRKIIHKYRL